MPRSSVRIIRRAEFTATAWKNGGGVTHEAVREPPGEAAFRWRVSVAHVESSGPFSDFAGYRRTMVLLRGAGLTLEMGGAAPRMLAEAGDLVQFDGSLAVNCRLADGPCVDLNVIAANAIQVSALVERAQVRTLDVTAMQTLLIFSLFEPLQIEVEGRDAVQLAPWDLAVATAAAVRWRAGVERAAVFMATLTEAEDCSGRSRG